MRSKFAMFGMGTKKTVSIGAAVLCCAAMSVAASSVATADETARAISVRCDAGGKVSFSPGLLPMPQDVTVTAESREHPCDDVSGNGITDGSFKGIFGAQLSCGLGAGSGTPGTARIGWVYENGTEAESEAEVTLTGQTLNQGNFSGTVKNGPFAGQSVEGNFSVDLASGAYGCAEGAPFGGLKEADFTGGFTILS